MHKPADTCDFRHAGHGFELIAQVPVLKGPQVPEAVFMCMIHQDVFIDPAGARRVRSDHRMDIRRQLSLNFLQVFEYSRARPIKVGSILEDNEDIRIPEHCLGAHGFDVRRGEHCSDDGVGYLILNDVGWLAGPGRINDDLDVGDVRQRIEGNVLHGPDAGEHEQKRTRKDQKRIARTPLNPTVDHVTCLPQH